jgi:hypothetical protein
MVMTYSKKEAPQSILLDLKYIKDKKANTLEAIRILEDAFLKLQEIESLHYELYNIKEGDVY